MEPRLLLVHLLRDKLGLTGTHVGCDTSNCGACTVHLDGQAVKSCTVLAVQADGAEVTTIEGLGSEGALHPMQNAFWENHGLQCGYCTPGMIMAATDLLQRNPTLRGGGSRGARGQPLPLHGLPQHRQGGARRGQGGGAGMSVTEASRRKHVGRSLKRKDLILAVIVMAVAVIAFIVFMERAQRRLLIQYPKRQVGNRMFEGQSSHLPLKLNTSGVIPPIFASSLLSADDGCQLQRGPRT